MKKLSKLTLRKIDVERSDILSKKDLKYIMGGYNSSDHCCISDTGKRCTISEGRFNGFESCDRICGFNTVVIMFGSCL